MQARPHVAKKNFMRVNNKDYAALLKNCAPTSPPSLRGAHALGGERHDREALRRWFERLGRRSPGLKLTVRDVWAQGLPHNTTVIIRWTAAQVLIRRLADPQNHGVHIVHMRWGKIVGIDADEDSQAVAGAMKVCAAHDLEEALADPITS